MLTKKLLLTAAVLMGPFLFLGGSCTTDPNFTENITATLNITGNYNVVTSPDGGLTNFTFTQTGNLVQAVDNEGTVYEGTTTGDIRTISVNQSNTFITATIQIQGTRGDGVVVTIVLNQVNATGFTFVTTTGTTPTVTAQPAQTTNLATTVFVQSLLGTYTNSTGLAGSIELVNNSVFPGTVTL